MKTNVGTVDRVIRIVLGLALLLLFGFGAIGAWGLLGLVPLATGVLGYCPLYHGLGIHTCARSNSLP